VTSPHTIVVTGASRGIGLELCRQALARGDRVVATTRRASPALAALQAAHPERCLALPLDLADAGAVERVGPALAALVDRVDLLVNNAGLYSTHASRWDPAATGIASADAAEFATVLTVNAVAPVLLLRACLPLLARSSRARVLNVSSLLGAVSAHDGPGDLAYAASKAALNIMTRALAAELAPQGIIVVAITPGWVRTDMGGPQATLSAGESVAGMLRVADALRPADSGRFVDYAGLDQPW